MEITSERIGDFIEVRPKGRLDGSWADHLSAALEEIIRRGDHRIRVNLSEVVYISSIGIGVLVSFYKKVAAIEGTFLVTEPSAHVGRVLSMSGLRQLIPDAAAPAAAAPKTEASHEVDGKCALFEVFALDSSGVKSPGMKCRTVGDPSLLEGCRFGEKDCRPLVFPDSCCAVGLGAFGHSFDECHDRFGEFLAVAGAAAYQPSGGANTPDYLLSQGTFVPELQVLYGAVGEGAFTTLARFEAKPESRVIGLAELAQTALEIAQADSAWMVMVAESAGLVGASLRRSPVNANSPGAPFGHPEIRSWLSFTTERAHTRALAVVVGLASASGRSSFLRPMGGQPSNGKPAPVGHFHAAAFSYRHLQRGLIDLQKTVRPLFEHESLLGLLHLIGDDREYGIAESEFVRGACWIGPTIGPMIGSAQ
ncbi:Anti-sigma factor antagonist [Candidatus Sulfopaludibacter sp. SbA4]|nr:Anti-sigma factor antagonist [Candidatus Sulfopaludibacter sp. SbA4]